MNTPIVNSKRVSTAHLISGILASLVGAAIMAYTYLYYAEDCTGTGTACNRSFACTVRLHQPELYLIALVNFLALPFLYWLFQRFGIRRQYWLVVLICYGLLILGLSAVWGLPNPRYAGVPCS